MGKKLISADELLNKIANGMGAKVVSWNTVEETIKKNICFAKIIDTSKYISSIEMNMLEVKSKVV